MTSELSIFAERLRDFISICAEESAFAASPVDPAFLAHADAEFNGLAMMLFSLQFGHNPPFRKFCEARKVLPNTVVRWTEIPALPAAAFKELELTCLPPRERATVFHSSGTTEQRPSRHFHSAESLAVYEASLWPWFREHVLADSQSPIANTPLEQSPAPAAGNLKPETWNLILLTPSPAQAPHSSLVHMFETIRRKLAAPAAAFLGRLAGDGSWTLNFDAALAALRDAGAYQRPVILLGTAFSFVHLVDHLAEQGLRFRLPPGSRAMETGGYKGRSRNLPKEELHALITQRLGIPADHIVCEYGMSELSSQAYDIRVSGAPPSLRFGAASGDQVSGGEGEHSTFNIQHPTLKERPDRLKAELQTHPAFRVFHFPPWARARVVSTETGREVAEGETGLLRIFDLANVFSVMAIQTEDLAARRGDGFELLGRATEAEPRGCSLMSQGPQSAIRNPQSK